MPKSDVVKRIDNSQPNAKASTPGGVRYSSSGLADKLDGYDASPVPGANLIPVAGDDGKLDRRWLPDSGLDHDQGSVLPGQVYLGPSVILRRPLSETSTTMTVDKHDHLAVGDSFALMHKSVKNEVAKITGGPRQQGGYYEYDISRGSDPQPYPAGAVAVDLGPGYIIMNSGDRGVTGVQAPHINMYQLENGAYAHKLRLGWLQNIGAPFTSLFPNADFDTFGLAAEDVFLSGSINATGGNISGDMTVDGRMIISGGAGDSRMEIGETAAGWGWTLRNSAGRPVVSALAPYNAEDGTASDVAFIIEHDGRKGFYYRKVGDAYKLDIGVDTLVEGTFRAGERILAGLGTWGTDFSGIALDSNYGFVGVSSSDTFDSDPSQGTYQTWWNRQDGKFYFAGGDVRIGSDGMVLTSDPLGVDAATRNQIRWRNDADTRTAMSMGIVDVPNGTVGTWLVQNQSGKFGSIQIDPSSAMTIATPAGVPINFYIGDTKVGGYTGSGFATLPITYYGSESVINFSESGRIGWNTDDPQAMIEVYDAEHAQFRAGEGTGSYGDLRQLAGNLNITSTGDIVLNPTNGYLLPWQTDTVNIGSASAKFLQLHVGEIVSQNLVAADVMSTIGGRVIVTPTTYLAFDVQISDTTIYTKHNNLASGDRVYFEARGNIEYMAVTSSGTLQGGGSYAYTVTRNLDGGGANLWYAGDAVVNTGATGDGFIDLYSDHGVKSTGEAGPTIVGNVRQSATYNDWEPRWAIGNLKGLYSYAATVYGAAFGDPNETHITIDDTNGYRTRNGSSTVFQIDTSGNVTVGNASQDATVYWGGGRGQLSSTGLEFAVDTDDYVEVNTDTVSGTFNSYLKVLCNSDTTNMSGIFVWNKYTAASTPSGGGYGIQSYHSGIHGRAMYASGNVGLHVSGDQHTGTYGIGVKAQSNDIAISGTTAGGSGKAAVFESLLPGAKLIRLHQGYTEGILSSIVTSLGTQTTYDSGEFIEFVGKAVSGNVTKNIVDHGDVSTNTLAGWVRVYVQDDGNQITDRAYYMPLYTLT